MKYYIDTTVWWYDETSYAVKWPEKVYGEMKNKCHVSMTKQLQGWNGEMVKPPQWGHSEMEKGNEWFQTALYN